LGKFLDLVLGLMRDGEVDLCKRLLEALRTSDKFADTNMGEDMGDLYIVLTDFLKTEEEEGVAESMGTDLLWKQVHECATACKFDFGVSSNGKVILDDPDSPRRDHSQPMKWVESTRSLRDGKDSEGNVVEGLPWIPSPKYGSFRVRLFVLFDDASQSIIGKVVVAMVMLAICLSTVTFIMESMPEFRETPAECRTKRTVKACEPQPLKEFFPIEAICISIFTVDYIVRIGTAHALPDYIFKCSPGNAAWRTFCYWRQLLSIIDLLAILPFYVGLLAGDGQGVGLMKILRLMRILRLFKMAKHHPGMKMFADVMEMSGQPLLILLFFNSIINVVFASLIYYAEGRQFSVDREFTDAMTMSSRGGPTALYPTGVYVRQGIDMETDEVSPFLSIPRAIWWVSVTMTTVGYGDFSPTTRVGKSIGVLCFYVGIIFLALPISVLGSNFEIVYERYVEKLAREAKDKPKRKSSKQSNRKSVSFRELGCFPSVPGIRKRIFLVFEDPQCSKTAKWVSYIMTITILVSTFCFVLESVQAFNETPPGCVAGAISVKNCQPVPFHIFEIIEVVCIILFTIDYCARVGTVHCALPEECGVDACYADKPGRKTLVYCVQYLNIIDAAAIIPFYYELFGGAGFDTAVLRVLRLVRIFRVLKMPKLRACAEMFINILDDAMPALIILWFMTSITCILFASTMMAAEGSWYSVDHFVDEYPTGCYVRPTTVGYDVEVTPFRDILFTFWWFFSTATTVGYGDIFPTTTLGRTIGICTFYVGIVLLALPITIVGGSFTKYYQVWVDEFAAEEEPNEPVVSITNQGCEAGADPASPICARPPLKTAGSVSSELSLRKVASDQDKEPSGPIGDPDVIEAWPDPMSPVTVK
jgi:voltage-gated potassium channel Kch